MKKMVLLFLASCLLPLRAEAQIVPGAPRIDWEKEHQEFTTDVLRAYNELIESWRGAWEKGDAKKASSYYSDGAFLFAEAQLIQGKGAVEAHLVKLLPRIARVKTGLSDFVASDRLAYALGPVWYDLRGLDGSMQPMAGTLLTVLVKEGKKWKIRSQIFR